MNEFERALDSCRSAVERMVRFRISSPIDAEDILQEVYLSAYRKFDMLKDIASFKPWLLQIARNKINDFYRSRARRPEIPMEQVPERIQQGIRHMHAVTEALYMLDTHDREILRLAYWLELPQAEIAQRLGVPIGTVKSRLFAARNHFRELYPQTIRIKGETGMKKLPDIMPRYTITPSSLPPFETRCEEITGWQIVPRLDEKLQWGLYEAPGGARTEYTTIEVVGEAEVHGIRGVEFVAVQHDAANYFRTGSVNEMERRFVGQLTATHSRILAESHVENGVRKCYTFLDGDAFMNNWGFGEDNCGAEVELRAKGILTRNGNCISMAVHATQTMDVVGRYDVEIGGKKYDTICLMDVECFDDSIVCEQYVDQNGRTVLWRRFNRDDWAFHRYQKKWTEILPNNERLTVNGEVYVHWYDCLTDYVL